MVCERNTLLVSLLTTTPWAARHPVLARTHTPCVCYRVWVRPLTATHGSPVLVCRCGDELGCVVWLCGAVRHLCCGRASYGCAHVW